VEGLSTFEVLRRCANPTVFDCACGLPFSDHKFKALDLGYAILACAMPSETVSVAARYAPKGSQQRRPTRRLAPED